MTDKINGRTPEEIKRGLEYCTGYGEITHEYCSKCPYIPDASCRDALEIDALALIQQLEERVVDLNKTSKQLEAAQPKWISVEERLPEPDKNVLTLKNRKCVRIGYYSEDCEEWVINDMVAYDEDITHWMPLPKAPKEEV